LSDSLVIANRQRAVSLNTRLLRSITESLLKDLLALQSYDLAVNILRAPEMAALNETFLDHEGSTDVITFDYLEHGTQNTEHGFARRSGAKAGTHPLHGEIFISIDDAHTQARQFRTFWQSELTRYVIHGVLHLRGFDDLQPDARRKMKRQEARLLEEIARLFPLEKLGRRPKLRP
jgi:probable rRNA maturation factor